MWSDFRSIINVHPIFPPHKTRSASSQGKQRGSLAGCVIRLQMARARAQHPIALYPPLNMGTRGVHWGWQGQVATCSPKWTKELRSANCKPFWGCNHSFIFACMHSFIKQQIARAMLRTPLRAHRPAAGARDSSVEQKDYWQGRICRKDEVELSPTGCKESATGGCEEV